MTQNILVPDIGDFDSVEIIEVLVKAGEQINKDDPIVTLESDKSSVEVPSPFAGKISDVKVKIGDKVSKGSLLAKLENSTNDNVKKETITTNQKQIETKKEESKNITSNKVVKKIITQPSPTDDIDPVETQEWIDSLNAVIDNDGSSRASYLLNKVISKAYTAGLVLPDTALVIAMTCLNIR